ncbi:MAG TPA: ABC transporter permease [bacterium]|uniref:Transport permease protein n=1 Tax=candidate division TA06 bacterium ADurb.Bin417 TaxID=1852828 RepID=A0A1V5MI91_UNCT6|nr:MAG: Inner membrane transport permease YadH [candidate division TA06 bacterium ADurb.Bin417]HNQ35785.1 ABC transporter permease [bacterium]HNS47932.1 ABC transporter permease [bacterium]
MSSGLGNISWRAVRVWQRNWTVYCATWLINFLAPILEPLLFLLAFGVGLGRLVPSVAYGGLEIPYRVFIMPGILAVSVMNYAFFETTYASFVRIYFQKTYDAILATPLLLEDVLAGEILWGATKSVLATAIMMVVVSCFGLLVYPAALWLIPAALLGGLAFASLGMIFTGLVGSIDQFNLPIFLLVTPMYLFGGVFFPLESLPDWAVNLAKLLPLTHLVIVMRQLALGRVDASLAGSLAALLVFGAACFVLALYLLRRRLIK